MALTNMRHWYLSRAQAAGGSVTPVGDSRLTLVQAGMQPGGWKAVLPFPASARDVAALPAGPEAVWTSVGASLCDADVRDALKRRGFEYSACAVTMARRAHTPLALRQTPAGMVLRPLGGMELSETTHHPSYGCLEQPAAQASWRAARRLAAGTRPAQLPLGAFLGDTLVATVTLHADGDSIGIYDVATLPEHRGRGYASWILGQALHLASQTWPFQPQVLQNDIGLVPLYERHDFVRVGVIEHWVLPAGRAPAAQYATSTALESLATAAVLEDMPACDALLAQRPELARQALPSGATALHLAAYNGSALATRRLIQAGADVAAPDRGHESSPLGWALFGLSEDGPPFKREQLRTAELLVGAGAPLGNEEQELARALGADCVRRLQGAADAHA
jgi:GNAT superfamily N-acetyltransferase